jgi:hypothetical protein
MDNRREFERYEHGFFIQIFLASLEKELDIYGQGINISQNGILFHTLAKFKVGTITNVSFKIKEKDNIIRTGKIIRIESENRSKYPDVKKDESIYAIQFDVPLSDDDMTDIRS